MSVPPALPRRRWLRGVQWAVLALVVGAMTSIFVNVLGTEALIGQMTTRLTTAQERAYDLSYVQRETLLLRLAIAELDTAKGVDAVELRRGLVAKHVSVTLSAFPPDSAEAAELTRIATEIHALDWDDSVGPGAAATLGRTRLAAKVTALELDVKRLHDSQEKFFHGETRFSVAAKRRSESTLVRMMGLVVLAVFGWVLALRLLTRKDLARAYHALVAEMTERQAAETALRTSEQRFRSLVHGASDLTAVTNPAGTFTYLSPAVEALLGRSPEDLVGRSLDDLVHPDDRQALRERLHTLAGRPGEATLMELRLRTRDGRWRQLEAMCRNLVDNPAVGGIVWNGRDVTDRRALQDELARQAFYDSLTGLANRALLLERVTGALADAVAEPASPVSVLLIDLDGFKNVNDTLGHAAGDDVLRVTSDRIAGCVRAGDTPARLGGDEFAVLLTGGSARDAAAVADRVLAEVRRPVAVAGREVAVGASIGVAHHAAGVSVEGLMRQADSAMYVAKTGGKNRVELFRPEFGDRAAERSTLHQELIRAVDRGQIELHYQPIFAVDSGAILAVEALARWRHPARGLIPPGVFIPLAEESGVIAGIGRHVLNHATEAAARWRATVPGCADLAVTVNVSGRQVISGDLATDVRDALAASGLARGALILEITESVLLEDGDVDEQFRRLKRLGARIAVDDFGAGYSSLGSLMRFSADTLKIDRTFLQFDSARQGGLVQAVSNLGRSLRLWVIAEGVETQDQLELARRAGCHAAQGYHLARPLPEDEVAHLLHDVGTGVERAAAMPARG